MKKIISSVAGILLASSGYSQEVEMADTMRSEGKIYVVVAILTVILLGLVTYLITIDRKVARLEKKLNEK
jgi:hypothetical protein